MLTVHSPFLPLSGGAVATTCSWGSIDPLPLDLSEGEDSCGVGRVAGAFRDPRPSFHAEDPTQAHLARKAAFFVPDFGVPSPQSPAAPSLGDRKSLSRLTRDDRDITHLQTLGWRHQQSAICRAKCSRRVRGSSPNGPPRSCCGPWTRARCARPWMASKSRATRTAPLTSAPTLKSASFPVPLGMFRHGAGASE